jgi:hypothetical protein
MVIQPSLDGRVEALAREVTALPRAEATKMAKNSFSLRRVLFMC